MTLKTAALLVAAIGALGSAVPAAAGPAQSPTATAAGQRISYADLDLLSPDGQAELQRRVDRAAWLVCQQNPNDARRAPRADSQCYREARQQGALRVAQVIARRPMLGG
jgi:UrcA family protein